jgi:hypothetical protein
MIRKFLLGVFSLCTLFLFIALGQNTGTLTGKVTAPDGRPVPSASVTVVDQSGQTRSAISGPDGAFTVANLPTGTYEVDVEVPGFKRLSQQNVAINPGSPIVLQLGMQAGNMHETVQVQGQAISLEDRNAEMGRGLDANVMQPLPVFDINHEQLLDLMTGISIPQIGPSPEVRYQMTPQPLLAASSSNLASSGRYDSILINPQLTRYWNTNGQLAYENETKTDGLLNQDQVLGMEMHEPAYYGIQQMNVVTSNYTPATGWAGGSVVNTETRPGTNGFHGDLFEYNAGSYAAARDYFNPVGTKQGVLTSNKFGGDFGAPIYRDKTFVFLDYQGNLLRDHIPSWNTVPTTALASGNFSGVPGLTLVNPVTGTVFANNTIPPSLINRSASAFLGALPAPNAPGFEYNYFSEPAVVNDGNLADVRIDHHINDRATIWGRYGLDYYNTSRYSPFGAIGADGGTSRLRGHNAAGGWTQSFGPNTYMTLRLGYDRYSDPINSLAPINAAAYGLGSGLLPEVSIWGMSSFGTNANYPQVNKEQTFQAADDWHAHFFNQDLTFGVNAWWIRASGFQNFAYGSAGGYTFEPGSTMLPGASVGPYSSYANALAAFLLGTPTTAGITSSSYLPSYFEQQYGGYIADHITIHNRLRLDLGVRYDFFRPVDPRNNANMYSIFNPANATLMPLGTASVNRYGNVLSNTLNFAPRVALAYRATEHVVVRTGYAWTYFDPSMLFGMSTLIPQMSYADLGAAGTLTTTGRPFGTLPTSTLNTSGPAPNGIYFFSPARVRTPYVQMYDFDVQADLTHGAMLDLAYVGNNGRELPYTLDVNSAAPGTGTAGMPFAPYGITSPVFERGTGFTSNYNSLQASLNKRFSQGIAFVAAYTWSRALDRGAGLTPFLDNLNPAANYGPANFDQNQVLTISHNIRLPFGAGTRFLNHGWISRVVGPWQFDGIFHWTTGMPYTPLASQALCNCPGNTATANVTPGPSYLAYGYIPSYFGFFAYPYIVNTQSFTQPAAGAFGNVGRNVLRGPSLQNYNIAVDRVFAFVEPVRLEFRAEAYNIFNTPNFAMPIADVNSPLFGQSVATMPSPDFGPRTLQFTLKLMF